MVFLCHLRYYGDVGVDLPTLLRQSSPLIPIMLLYRLEAEVALKLFNDFAYKKQVKTHILPVTDNNPNTEKTARKFIQKAMAEVSYKSLFFNPLPDMPILFFFSIEQQIKV